MTVGDPQQRKKLGESLYTRALGLASEGHLDEAEHHFEEALKLCPQDARIWYHRGHLHEQMGKLESAIHCYNKARSGDRNNPMYERSWREAVRMLDQLPAVPSDAGQLDAVATPPPRAAPQKRSERKTIMDPAPGPSVVLPTLPTPSRSAPSGPALDLPLPPPEVQLVDCAPGAPEQKAILDLPIFNPDGLEAVSTQVFDEQEEQTVHGGGEETVRTVERIGGTWVLWNSRREDDHDDLDTLRTDSDQMFSASSAATLVVPLDELEAEDEIAPPRRRGRRDTARFVNRRNARILDSSQLSVIGMACLRLIAEGDAAQVVELMQDNKYPDLKKVEAHFLLATAYITLAERTLLEARALEGGLAEHLKTLKLWFEQR